MFQNFGYYKNVIAFTGKKIALQFFLCYNSYVDYWKKNE